MHSIDTSLCVCVYTAVISWVCVRLMMRGVINQGTMRYCCNNTWQLCIARVYVCACLLSALHYNTTPCTVWLLCMHSCHFELVSFSVFLLWFCVHACVSFAGARFAVSRESLACPAVWQEVVVWAERMWKVTRHHPCECFSLISFLFFQISLCGKKKEEMTRVAMSRNMAK